METFNFRSLKPLHHEQAASPIFLLSLALWFSIAMQMLLTHSSFQRLPELQALLQIRLRPTNLSTGRGASGVSSRVSHGSMMPLSEYKRKLGLIWKEVPHGLSDVPYENDIVQTYTVVLVRNHGRL